MHDVFCPDFAVFAEAFLRDSSTDKEDSSVQSSSSALSCLFSCAQVQRSANMTFVTNTMDDEGVG